MFISADLLRHRGVCPEHVAKFLLAFPDGCNVTRKNIKRATEFGCCFHWAAEYLFTPSVLAAYKEARATASKKLAAAAKRYEAAGELAFLAAAKADDRYS